MGLASFVMTDEKRCMFSQHDEIQKATEDSRQQRVVLQPKKRFVQRDGPYSYDVARAALDVGSSIDPKNEKNPQGGQECERCKIMKKQIIS